MKNTNTFLKILKWALFAHLAATGWFIIDHNSIIPKIVITITALTYGGMLIYAMIQMSKGFKQMIRDVTQIKTELEGIIEQTNETEKPE